MIKKSKGTLAYLISRFVDITEMIISLVLIIGIVYLLIEMAIGLYGHIRLGEAFDFNDFLENLFNLVIGVEFTRMMCQHTPNTIIEVLMFATARQLIISHSGALDSLFGVIAIAGLFAVRKFIMPTPSQEDDSGFIFRRPDTIAQESQEGQKDEPPEDASEA